MKSYLELTDTSAFEGENAAYLEALYEQYAQNPASVSEAWQQYFAHHFQQAKNEPNHSAVRQYFLEHAKNRFVHTQTSPANSNDSAQCKIFQLIQAYRQYGHVQAKIDPLGLTTPSPFDLLSLQHHDLTSNDNTLYDADHLAGLTQASVQTIFDTCQKIYCGSIGFEYEHIGNPSEVAWLQTRIEQWPKWSLSKEQKIELLKQLTATEGLEKVLGARYVGVTRFSVEGGDTQIPLLNYLIKNSTKHGMKEIVIGMAHRGRLNVLANVLGMPTQEILSHFEGTHEYHPDRSDDVKYHYGYSTDLETSAGPIHVSLAFNPSHLEIIAPVVQGSVRARQDRRDDTKHEQVLAIQFHGDSAFAGQGVVMETFQLAQTRGFTVGGSIHIVVNNQVGFTTSNREDTRSTTYCTDVAKMIDAPIFHVNGDDPEAVLFIAQLALAYHEAFHKDVIIDLVCYRRFGHNEGDEPSATQPLMYQTIKKLLPVRQLYAAQLVWQHIISEEQAGTLVEEYRTAIDQNTILIPQIPNPDYARFIPNWAQYEHTPWTAVVQTALAQKAYEIIAPKITEIPKGFVLQAQVARALNARAAAYEGKQPLVWGDAELLAYASLAYEGCRVRLVGQDSGRGTFAHRHAVVYDQTTGAPYVSLNHLSASQAPFTVVDSVLSENAVMAFEYGYASTEPKALVLWEAQYGDFVNGAQVVIDQFLSAGEQKWGRYCGLVLLLPHGYEGAGPEHSSARLERFLQLCAQDNMQVCIPTTPAQIFHVLRRQVLRPYRKPLIILSPKAMLRKATSDLRSVFSGSFQCVIPPDNAAVTKIKRLILCSGKVYYDLEEQRIALKRDDIAIARLEQLYPFPTEAVRTLLSTYKKTKTIVWCQEEPKNQGAWLSLREPLEECLQEGQQLNYVGRAAAASTAAGYKKLHEAQKTQFIEEALK